MKGLITPIVIIILIFAFAFYNLYECKKAGDSLLSGLSDLPGSADPAALDRINELESEWDEKYRFVFAKCSRSDHVLSVSREFVNLKEACEAGEDDTYKCAKGNLFSLLNELKRLQEPSFRSVFG